MPIALALLIAVLLSFVAGAVLEFAVIRRVQHASHLTVVIYTFGLFIAIEGLMGIVWGYDPRVPVSMFPQSSLGPSSIGLSWSVLGIDLWTLPMFHCNGWCFTWAVTAAGGTHVCLPSIDVEEIWRRLRSDGITHLSAAPTVLTMIAEAPSAGPLPDGRTVSVSTGGAPPSPSLLDRLDHLGLRVTHLYGLTETYGPLAINEWQAEWDARSPQEQARLRARQGIGNIIAAPLRVVTPEGADVEQPIRASYEQAPGRDRRALCGIHRAQRHGRRRLRRRSPARHLSSCGLFVRSRVAGGWRPHPARRRAPIAVRAGPAGRPRRARACSAR